MCEILDQIEQRGIRIGEEHMRAENDALSAENDTLSAENNTLNAEVAHMKELLARNHIVIA